MATDYDVFLLAQTADNPRLVQVPGSELNFQIKPPGLNFSKNGIFVTGGRSVGYEINSSAFIAGTNNIIGSTNSIILGGSLNVLSGTRGVGAFGTTPACSSLILGGTRNTNQHSNSVILGGAFNKLSGTQNVDFCDNAIIGGNSNEINSSSWSTIINGDSNKTVRAYGGGIISSMFSLISGSDPYISSIFGGQNNAILEGVYSNILAGCDNVINNTGISIYDPNETGFYNNISHSARACICRSKYSTIIGSQDSSIAFGSQATVLNSSRSCANYAIDSAVINSTSGCLLVGNNSSIFSSDVAFISSSSDSHLISSPRSNISSSKGSFLAFSCNSTVNSNFDSSTVGNTIIGGRSNVIFQAKSDNFIIGSLGSQILYGSGNFILGGVNSLISTSSMTGAFLIGDASSRTKQSPGSHTFTVDYCNIILRSQVSPTSPNSPGYSGQLAFEDNYFYRHNGSNWTRTAMSTW